MVTPEIKDAILKEFVEFPSKQFGIKLQEHAKEHNYMQTYSIEKRVEKELASKTFE